MSRRGRRGDGTVYWSKSDRRWIARFPLGVVDGRRVTKRVKCRTRDEADDELVNLRRLYGAGGKPATGTLDAYLRSWLPGHLGIAASTRRSYRLHIERHIGPLLGGIALAKLAPRDVRRLIVDLERKGLSAGTVRLVIRTLSVALNAAVHERSIVDNATVGVRLPRVERDPVHPLTAAEADAIVAAADPTWMGPLVRFLLGSGVRLGEACGLDQGDLMLDAGYVRLRKSKTGPRPVPVSDDAIVALREARASAPRRGTGEPVFFGPRRNRAGHRDRLRGSTASHALPRILERAGLGHLAPHALRHGAATLMLADGVPMRVIAEQLGHRNPALTAQVYAHVIPEAQRRAVGSLERRRRR